MKILPNNRPFRIEDRVKIIKKFETNELDQWVDDMKQYVGKIGNITDISEKTGYYFINGWYWPAKSLRYRK